MNETNVLGSSLLGVLTSLITLFGGCLGSLGCAKSLTPAQLEAQQKQVTTFTNAARDLNGKATVDIRYGPASVDMTNGVNVDLGFRAHGTLEVDPGAVTAKMLLEKYSELANRCTLHPPE